MDDRLMLAGIADPNAMRDFLDGLKAAVRSENWQALVSSVRYPLTLYRNGEPQQTYAGPAALLSDVRDVFTPAVLKAILASEYQALFVNAQGAMIGDGEVWIDGRDGRIAIKALNP